MDEDHRLEGKGRGKGKQLEGNRETWDSCKGVNCVSANLRMISETPRRNLYGWFFVFSSLLFARFLLIQYLGLRELLSEKNPLGFFSFSFFFFFNR